MTLDNMTGITKGSYTGVDMYKLLLGDSAEVLKQLPAESVDMAVTSPPYDNLRDYNGFTFDFETIAEEMYRVTRPGGVVVWIVADGVEGGSETGTSFEQALYFKKCGFNLHDTMIWHKSTGPFPDNLRYKQVFEYMFILSKGKPKTINKIKDRKNLYAGSVVHGTTRQKDGSTKPIKNGVEIEEYGERENVWRINEEKHNITGHPAVFPVKLARDHIISWSNAGDVVLDPFMGSGTTGVACVETEREFIGIEISEEYYDIAKKRIEEESAQFRFNIGAI